MQYKYPMLTARRVHATTTLVVGRIFALTPSLKSATNMSIPHGLPVYFLRDTATQTHPLTLPNK